MLCPATKKTRCVCYKGQLVKLRKGGGQNEQNLFLPRTKLNNAYKYAM